MARVPAKTDPEGKTKYDNRPLWERERKDLATKEPSAMHKGMAEFITKLTGIKMDPKQVQAVVVLHHVYQRSPYNQEALAAGKAAREQALKDREAKRAERAKAKEEREAKAKERAEAKAAKEAEAAKGASVVKDEVGAKRSAKKSTPAKASAGKTAAAKATPAKATRRAAKPAASASEAPF